MFASSRSRFTLLIAAALTLPPTDTAPPLWIGMTPGAWRTVGFRRVDSPDGRVDLWYPASKRGAAMSYREYMGESADGFAKSLAGAGIPRPAVDSLLNGRVFATLNAAPHRKRFPLVLLAQGNGQDAADQAILAEYLASSGYIVASTPSPMIQVRLQDEREIGKFAEQQAAELAAAVQVANRALRIRPGNVGVIGHSFGARAALLFAMRSRNVAALVSLDGGIGTALGVESMKGAPSFNADTRLPALLHFYEELDAFMKPDFVFLQSLSIAKLDLRATRDMHHVHFTSIGNMAALDARIGKLTGAGADIRRQAATIAPAIRAFLDARLK